MFTASNVMQKLSLSKFIMIKCNKHLRNASQINSQICSSLTEQRVGHRAYEFRLILLFTTGQYHKDNHSILQETSAVIMSYSDSDNSIVHEDISLLFYNVISLVAGAAIISRQIKTRTLFYVIILHLHRIYRYEKISCYFVSCTVIFEKC